MRTTKPISTISYNTEPYLKGKLNELVKAKKISVYHYIKHEPEEDEKKQHFHVWCVPSKMLQTDDLRDELKEPDPEHPDKPLGCLPFDSSDFGNWYLYALHDPGYLTQKNMSRKYHYRRDMIVSSDDDYLDEQVRKIDLLHLSPYSIMLDAIEHGVTFEDFVARGTIPIPQFANWQNVWFALIAHVRTTRRNGREPHSEEPYDSEKITVEGDMKIDTSTGEVIE